MGNSRKQRKKRDETKRNRRKNSGVKQLTWNAGAK
jgi:hypothetical protein